MVRVHNDVDLRAELTRHTADTDGGAYAVQITEAVAHDQDPRRVAYQFGKGIGHDAGLDLRALLNLEAAAAVELEAHLVLDDRLVAAPGEGKLTGRIRKLQRLAEVRGVDTEADAYRRGNAGRALDLMYLSGYPEFFALERLQVMPLHKDQISVAVKAADNAVKA